jgi:hypothetical protein
MDDAVDALLVLLPGGYVDGHGVRHREVELAPLTGREEELIARSQGRDIAALVTTVLRRCMRRIGAISPVSEEVTRHLLVADRQYLLLKLREATLGERVHATILCPWLDCNKKITVHFLVNDVPVTELEEQGPLYTMQLSPEAIASSAQGEEYRDITFRLPNGGDQEALTPILAYDEARALILLLQRCIQCLGPLHNPDEDMISRLSPLARMEIEQRMAAVAPKVELTMESKCPECGREYAAPFDLQPFFFSELHTRRELLYREVHYLAYHYHWSEREIMGMPRQRRRAYIEMLAGELERLNNAV